MKKKCLLFIALLLALGACQNAPIKANANRDIDFDKLEQNDYVPVKENTEKISAFNLISPTNGKEIEVLETFRWEAATNADKYAIEICSSPHFISDSDAVDYYSQKNINATSWNVNVTFNLKDTTYYWRVIASNGADEVYSTQAFSFFLKAPEVEEVYFDFGDADDWLLHPVGSYADISIDNSNFFNNNQESVVVSFKQEDTNRGVATSDGWVIVTKTIEKSIYGTDALFFNLYYSGQDADIYIRLVDRDNEYWFAPVQVSNNAKQSVILKFSDFVQRTKDVTVANQIFDYERIKYLEIVFERSFGDGILLMSGMKAIKFDNYSDYFIQKLDYTYYPESSWTHENYNFERIITKDELTLKYYNAQTGDYGKINGYGFAKLYVYQYFYSGDSIKVSIKYTGAKGTNVVMRIYEEDTDRWSYKIPFSLLSEEYSELVIPFSAFGRSDTQGDGRRQFYNIINIQFGLEGEYGTGSLSFKDFEIVNKKDYQKEEYRVVKEDGLIENFNNYKFPSDLFMVWSTSKNNKDEYMQLSTNKVGGESNPFSGQFDYKSDMEAAKYTLPVSASGDFTSFSIWMKDASIKTGDAKYEHVTNYSADTTIYINLNGGEIYSYHLGQISRVWTEYDIPFSSFEIVNRDDLNHVPSPVTTGGIKEIAFSLQYFYYSALGKPTPLYTISNPVYVDNIYLSNGTEYTATSKESIVTMDGDIAKIDDFENYKNTSEMCDNWLDGRDYDYQKKELSHEVSKEGGKNSMAVQYKANAESPSYYISPAFAPDVVGRGVRVSMYSEKSITVYVNLYINIGTSKYQYRATLTNTETAWCEYVIGLNNFNIISGSRGALDANDLIYVERISFGVSYYEAGGNLYNLYIDNLMFDYSLSYSANTRRVIE